MKQYMKRVLLVLSMVVSLFALSACSNKNAAEAETMDPQTASYISQISENLHPDHRRRWTKPQQRSLRPAC